MFFFAKSTGCPADGSCRIKSCQHHHVVLHFISEHESEQVSWIFEEQKRNNKSLNKGGKVNIKSNN